MTPYPSPAPTPVASPLIRRRLLPGHPVVSREVGVLQVGLDPPHRALLPDLSDVRRLLDALADGRPVRVGSGPAAGALGELERAGLLVPSAAGAVGDALLSRHGPRAIEVAAELAAVRVHLDVGVALRPEALRLLGAAGLGTSSNAGSAAGSTAVPTAGPPDVVLVAATTTLARDRLDRWVREGVPHLCLEAVAGGLVVGPLVVPGRTACLRCIDAHRGEQDPHRAAVLDRMAARQGSSPYDAVAVSLALAWAVRDLRLLVEGERPATWSSTVAIDVRGGPVELAPTRWRRHPCCGCAWDVTVSAAG